MGEPVFSDNLQLQQQDDGLEVDSLSGRDMLLRLFTNYLKPRMGLLCLSLGAMLIVAAATGLMPILVKYAIDALLEDTSDGIPLWLPISIVVVTAFKALSDFFVNVTRSYLG